MMPYDLRDLASAECHWWIAKCRVPLAPPVLPRIAKHFPTRSKSHTSLRPAAASKAPNPVPSPRVPHVAPFHGAWYNSSMSIEFDATYRSGAIIPNQPLALPENTPIHVVVVEKDAAVPGAKPRAVSLKGLTRDEIIALRPNSPKLTPEEFDAIIEKYSISARSLPPGFSREDIYSDHD